MPAAKTRRHHILCVAGFATSLLAACADPDLPSPGDLNARYEQQLKLTATSAHAFAPDSSAEQAVLARVADYFDDMTPDAVRAETRSVYAADGWLYDNLPTVAGVENVEAYFVHAAEQADTLDVEFLQIARDDVDYFVRWRMTITSAALNDGAPLVSYGISHFRFNSEGKVLVHRDFWDAGTGIYEYLPGFGGLVRAVRSQLASY